MREYKALFIIESDKEASLKEILGSIAAGITKVDGKISKEENWGKQHLAYPINKKPDGIYYKLDFSMDPSKLKALNSSFKLNSDILRVMITVK